MVESVEVLEQLKLNDVIVPLDYHLALFFIKQSPLDDPLLRNQFALLVAWMSIELRAGHVCVNLSEVTSKNINTKFGDGLTQSLFEQLQNPSLNDWIQLCQYLGQEIIGNGEFMTPFVLQGNNLYFQRMWQYEKQVAKYFASLQHNDAIEPKLIKKLLLMLFPESRPLDQIDWQKIAVISALTQKIAIISGGPGTGKTTTVSKILAAIVALHLGKVQSKNSPKLRIIAAAPTGKAAARLTESLAFAIETLTVSSEIKSYLPIEAITLHRLLGANSNGNKYRYHKKNPLSVDILLIDEVSMVDLPMMAHVIDALPHECRMILLGDKEQLSSVEAGAVFGDLCELIDQGYSQQYVKLINEITGYQLVAKQQHATIADSVCLLQKSYRFDDKSGIGTLASLIKEGKHSAVLALFDKQQYQDVAFHDLSDNHSYQKAINLSVDGYKPYLSEIKNQPNNVKGILKSFSQFRLLCAVREGVFGVQGLNRVIEHAFRQNGMIELQKQDAWYVGRPVMILRNSFSLGLFNGDIGITLPSLDEQDRLRVYFLLPSGEIKGFSPLRLPEHETAYAMTIHKSQGSEFEKINIILPNEYTSLLTRSLLYTAVTRAKKHVTIYSSDKILDRIIRSKTYRQSGLLEQIKHFQQE